MELAQNFWKYASKSNAIDNIENIFIKWAGESKLSIDEFNSTYTEINNQINEFFGKKEANIRIESDGSVSGPAEEVQQYIQKLQQQEQNNIPQESDLNQDISQDMSIENPAEDIKPAQQSIENESPVGQDNIQNESIGGDINKTSISSEPNAEISEDIPEENNQFPLLDILGS
jgi:hypothetical protein